MPIGNKKDEVVQWITAIEGISCDEAKALYRHGYTTKRSILDVHLIDLVPVEGLGFSRAKEIRQAIDEYIDANKEISEDILRTPTEKKSSISFIKRDKPKKTSKKKKKKPFKLPIPSFKKKK